MLTRSVRKGLSIAREAIQEGLSIAREIIDNTGAGEWLVYGLLLFAGVTLIIAGWLTQAHGWDTNHAYAVGLLDGLTGFCFGVPVAGLLLREVTRRGTESAERRTAIHTVTSQLDYLRSLVESPPLGRPLLPVVDSESLSVSERLGKLAETANSAARDLQVSLKGEEAWVAPGLPEETVPALLDAVYHDGLWDLVSFTCNRLVGDVSRLAVVLFPPAPSRPALPDWFTYLAGTLHNLLGKLSAHPAARLDVNEAREELYKLADKLQALAWLIDAGDRASSQLSDLIGESRNGDARQASAA